MATNEPKYETKPDPLVRQSDISILEGRQRIEHIKTRALVVVLATPSVAKAVPYVLGYFGWKVGMW